MDENQPAPGVHVLQHGDAVVVFLAPGVDIGGIDQEQLGTYLPGVTFHFVEGVVGVAVKPR